MSALNAAYWSEDVAIEYLTIPTSPTATSDTGGSSSSNSNSNLRPLYQSVSFEQALEYFLTEGFELNIVCSNGFQLLFVVALSVIFKILDALEKSRGNFAIAHQLLHSNSYTPQPEQLGKMIQNHSQFDFDS